MKISLGKLARMLKPIRIGTTVILSTVTPQVRTHYVFQCMTNTTVGRTVHLEID